MSDQLRKMIAGAAGKNPTYDNWMAIGAYLTEHAADFANLIEAAERSLDAEQVEAKAKLSVEIAESNFTDSKPESAAYIKALLQSIKASDALREALKPFAKE